MLDIVEREIPHRDSFGFLESTSVVTPPEGLRISIGQESKEELVEKLYGIGWLNEKKPAVLRVDDLVAQISEDAERATSQMEAMFPFVQWADASLQVLKGRVVDKGSEEYAEILACERLLVSLVKSRRTAGSRADADADETRLKSDMARLYRRTGDGVGTAQLIGEQLRIVGSVFSSAMDDATRQGLDIQGMRSGVSRRSRSGDSGQNVIQTQYLPNMLASMMSLMQCVYEGEEELDDAQLKLINDLHDALLGGPLPGVSDSTRNRFLKGSFKFQCLALARKDKSEQQEGAMQILATARLFTKPEDRVEIFHRIPERLISKMDDHVRTALVDTLISPLSQELLQAYVDRLTVNKDSFPEKFKLVGSCMKAEPVPDPCGAGAPQ